MLLAQASVESLPDSFLKNIVILAIIVAVVTALLSGSMFAGLTYLLQVRQAKNAEKSAKEPQFREIQPIPLPIEMTEKFVPHSVFDTHVTKTENEFQRLEDQRSEDLRMAALSRRTMYGKQDELRKELTERTEAVRKELSQKIDGSADRVIATLRNTGAIGGNQS